MTEFATALPQVKAVRAFANVQQRSFLLPTFRAGLLLSVFLALQDVNPNYLAYNDVCVEIPISASGSTTGGASDAQRLFL